MAKKAAGKGKKRARSSARTAVARGKTRAEPVARSAGEDSAQPVWKPSKFALWSQRWRDPRDASPTSVLLRHPTAPFVRRVDKIDDKTMQQVGFDYLRKASGNENVDPPLGLPKRWIEALNPATGPDSTFRWLPIGWPPPDLDDPDAGNPFVSFNVERKSSGSGARDRMIVLLASEWLTGHYVGSGFGIRLIAHVRKIGSRFEVRVTGMTASLPFGYYLKDGLSTNFSSLTATGLVISFDLVLANKDAITTEMANLLRLRPDSVKIQGFRIGRAESGLQVEWRCTGNAKTSVGPVNPNSYSFAFVGNLQQAGALVSKIALAADATPVPGHAQVFLCDPASQGEAKDIRKRRPTRSEERLDRFRVDEEITSGRRDPLQHPQSDGRDMRVLVCPACVLNDRDPPIKPGDMKKVDLPGTGPALRSNDLSAVMAYWNVEQFFERLDAYGINANNYFRIAKLPLKVFYRSGIRPGPGKDGETVNARVLVEGFPVGFEGPTPANKRPPLSMHFALANLSTRARKVWDGKHRSPAQPLGIASDARWVWHEIGHVLLMASVGELQFRFAHSPGDALAAIASDPQSKLATDGNWRGATFPWVFLPRRHDRCVSHGWSWGGGLHYALSQVEDSQTPRRKAYWSEQILSSSLFRLYRCIGGDTAVGGSPDQPDIHSRDSASHYSVYLIIRAIQTLGTSLVTTITDPDQFVSALIDTDINTGQWSVKFPQQNGDRFDRVGGCVHKVVRWAFEAQGLYRHFTNGPGNPPPVDIYIESHRSGVNATDGGIQYGPGSYYPVSLDWNLRQNQSSVPPAWQATAGAIAVNGNGIHVTVGNRGDQPATNVAVRVWSCKWPAGKPPPQWDTSGSGWIEHGLNNPGQTSQGQTVDPGGTASFGPFDPVPPQGRRIVFAQATCGDDRANTDPATLLPCSYLPTPLVDLVANDNNLGLRVIGQS